MFGALQNSIRGVTKRAIVKPGLGAVAKPSSAITLPKPVVVGNSFARPYSLREGYYFHKYYPPTGVPSKHANDEPWDYLNRPKRRQGQLARRLEKLIQLNDYYTIFTTETPEIVPRPTPIVPEPRNEMTVEKFLKTIGRGCGEYIDKFEGSWEKLFSSKSRVLKEMGIPVRNRKWILHWTERYRQGDDPWYVPLRSKSAKNSYDKLEWRKKLVTQKHLREEWGLE